VINTTNLRKHLTRDHMESMQRIAKESQTERFGIYKEKVK
jgi:hypothetical protein